MWQVYLYLANQRQDQARGMRATGRPRRWGFGRRADTQSARPTIRRPGPTGGAPRAH